MLMKRFIFTILIFLILLPTGLAETDKWHIYRSTHFIIHYRHAEEGFIDRLIERSEDYYNKITDDLGFRRYNFWLWDNRAKIYIYDDSQSYQAATGQPGWSSGCAVVGDKIIHTFPNARGFFDTILPHELSHIIFREFVGFDNSAVPIWLDEGVASYQEKLRRQAANKVVKEAIGKGSFFNLEQLSHLNPQSMQDTEQVNLFYAEALSVVDYLIKEFGKDNFVLFCQKLRDNKNLENAMRYSYPFKDVQSLDRQWQDYLRE